MNPLEIEPKKIEESEEIFYEDPLKEIEKQNPLNQIVQSVKKDLFYNIQESRSFNPSFKELHEFSIQSLNRLEQVSSSLPQAINFTEGKREAIAQNLFKDLFSMDETNEAGYKKDAMAVTRLIVESKEAFDNISTEVITKVCNSHPSVKARCEEVGEIFTAVSQNIFNNVSPSLLTSLDSIVANYHSEINKEIDKNIVLGISAETTKRFYQDLPKLALITIPGPIIKKAHTRLDKKIKMSGKGEISGKKPVISSKKIIKIAQNLGYIKVKGGKGSHTKLKKSGSPTLIVPKDDELGKGILLELWKQLEEAIKKSH